MYRKFLKNLILVLNPLTLLGHLPVQQTHTMSRCHPPHILLVRSARCCCYTTATVSTPPLPLLTHRCHRNRSALTRSFLLRPQRGLNQAETCTQISSRYICARLRSVLATPRGLVYMLSEQDETNFARGPTLMLYEFISLTLLQGRGVSEG